MRGKVRAGRWGREAGDRSVCRKWLDCRSGARYGEVPRT